MWADNVRRTLNKVRYDLPPVAMNLPPGTMERSIYKVPDLLRKSNEQAYTPELISIGPFHYASEELQPMVYCKRQCLKYFIEQYRVDWQRLEGYIDDAKEKEVRNSYADDFQIGPDHFKEMILLDASFIIVLFLRNWEKSQPFIRVQGDDIKIEPWMATRIQLDLILLENQLPFPFIQHLFDVLGQRQPRYPNFMLLTFDYFKSFNIQEIPYSTSLKVNHFVDLLRHFYLRPLSARSILPERSNEEVQEMYCASQLADAGMKFKLSSNKCLLELKYDNGELEIPKFKLNKGTEICAWNVVAYEQCHNQEHPYVTDYFLMLCFLIQSRRDMDLLLREEIILERQIGNIMATLPHSLCTNISGRNINKEYYGMCEKMAEFYRGRWFGFLKTTLKRDYFNTPWMGAASLGGIILLLLTLMQTVCSLLSLH